MIAYLAGPCIHDFGDWMIVAGGDVGYEVVTNGSITEDDFPENGIYLMHVVDTKGVHTLHGFKTVAERNFALFLTKVPRVGGVTAARVVQLAGWPRVAHLIAQGDAAGLCKAVRGVGTARSQDIVRAVKKKASTYVEVIGDDTRFSHAFEALQVLGHEPDPEKLNQLLASDRDLSAGDVVNLYLARVAGK